MYIAGQAILVEYIHYCVGESFVHESMFLDQEYMHTDPWKDARKILVENVQEQAWSRSLVHITPTHTRISTYNPPFFFFFIDFIISHSFFSDFCFQGTK